MHGGAQFRTVTIRRAQIGGQFDVRGSIFSEKLDLDAVRIDGYVFMDESAQFNEINLVNAKIGGLITFQKSTIAGQLIMDGLTVSGDLMMSNGAKFGGIAARSANVTGDVDLSEANVDGPLIFENIRISGSLIIRKGNLASNLELQSARIGGDLDAGGAQIGGAVLARDVSVDQALHFDEGSVQGEVNLRQAKVKGNVSLGDGAFGGVVDLSDSQIGGRFLLSGKEKFPKMLLTRVGFSSAEWGSDPVAIVRKISGALDEREYSSGFYDKLAKSYSEVGQSSMARSILIQRQNAEYQHAGSWFEKAYLFVWWLLSGYGYKPEIGLAWILGCVVVGAFVFKSGGKAIVTPGPPRSWFVFAIDSVIPGIHLNKDHEKIEFIGWRQYVLYFLRFLGAVLVVLVIDVLKQSVTVPK
jgi:hypothetical protein